MHFWNHVLSLHCWSTISNQIHQWSKRRDLTLSTQESVIAILKFALGVWHAVAMKAIMSGAHSIFMAHLRKNLLHFCNDLCNFLGLITASSNSWCEALHLVLRMALWHTGLWQKVMRGKDHNDMKEGDVGELFCNSPTLNLFANLIRFNFDWHFKQEFQSWIQEWRFNVSGFLVVKRQFRASGRKARSVATHLIWIGCLAHARMHFFYQRWNSNCVFVFYSVYLNTIECTIFVDSTRRKVAR